MPGDIVIVAERRYRVHHQTGASLVCRPISGGMDLLVDLADLQWDPVRDLFVVRLAGSPEWDDQPAGVAR
jgi:hypothetical protein